MGALNGVYINIGTFSEEWLLHFNALVGGKPVSPIEISVARKNSPYFVATEAQTFNTALFFLRSTNPHYLKDAPGGDKYLTKDKTLLKNSLKIMLGGLTQKTASSRSKAAVYSHFAPNSPQVFPRCDNLVRIHQPQSVLFSTIKFKCTRLNH
jgi:hypothetical protein